MNANKREHMTLRTATALRAPAGFSEHVATLRADTLDESARTVDVVVATEQAVRTLDFRTFRTIDEVLLMDGAAHGERVPLLESHLGGFRRGFSDHPLDNHLGSVRNLRRDGDQFLGRLHFASGDPVAERNWNKVRQGHITDVSVGATLDERGFVTIEPRESAVINGRTFTAAAERPLRVVRSWTIKEVSLVSIGADDQAKVREWFGHGSTEGEAMNKQLREFLVARGLGVDASDREAWAFFDGLSGSVREEALGLTSDAELAARNGQPHNAEAQSAQRAAEDVGGNGVASSGTPAATATRETNGGAGVPSGTRGADGTHAADGTDDPPITRAALQTAVATAVAAAMTETREAEAARVASIRDYAELAGERVPEEVVDRAISEGWQPERARDAFLAAMRQGWEAPMGTRYHINTPNRERDCTVDSMGAALAIRAGLNPLGDEAAMAALNPEARAAAERAANQATQYQYMTLLDYCKESCRMAGVSLPHAPSEIVRAAVSTPSLTNIFSNVVRKMLMGSFQEAEDTTSGLTIDRDVPNYKTNERHRLGKTGDLEKLPRGGTAKHATISDLKETYQIARYAKQFAVDEQDIIDDDMNALLEMPAELGAAAARLRPDLVYAILMGNPNMRDSVALFHANHGNLGTTGTALAEATLGAAIEAMMIQTEDGEPLNLSPRFLVVPPKLIWTARRLLESEEIREAASANGTKNVLQGLLSARAETRLQTGFTDPDGTTHAGSNTAYFLFAPALMGKTIEVGYLTATNRGPQLRPYVLDKGQWGIGWDIKFDIGAKALDWRGMYKATGAA